MKRCASLALLAALLILPAGCRTEIEDKPAAEIVAPGSGDAAAETVERRVEVDPQRSAIRFVGAKMTGQHTGEFHEFDGWVGFRGDEPVQIEFTIETASLETDTERLDRHLRSPDFFDSARFPRATFTSSSIEPVDSETAEGATHQITGTLDLHGVQKEIRFPASVGRTPEELRAVSQFTIDRKDWEINYPGDPDDLIRDAVLIKLDLFFPLEQPQELEPATGTAAAPAPGTA